MSETLKGGREGRGRGTLPSSEVAAFCEGLAAMLAAGIQLDEGLGLLGESAEGTPLAGVCDELYGRVAGGEALSDAMAASGRFPEHAVSTLAVAGRAGRTERALRGLAGYYAEESRVMDKLRTAVGYPAALLCVMSVVLVFTVAVILPVFIGVYEDMAGSLTAGSGLAVGASVAVGWVALVVVVLVTAAALAGVAASRSVRGQAAIVRLMGSCPSRATRCASSRFRASWGRSRPAWPPASTLTLPWARRWAPWRALGCAASWSPPSRP